MNQKFLSLEWFQNLISIDEFDFLKILAVQLRLSLHYEAPPSSYFHLSGERITEEFTYWVSSFGLCNCEQSHDALLQMSFKLHV